MVGVCDQFSRDIVNLFDYILFSFISIDKLANTHTAMLVVVVQGWRVNGASHEPAVGDVFVVAL